MQYKKAKPATRVFRRSGFVLAFGGALLISACSDTSVNPPRAEDAAQLARAPRSVSLDLVAKGLAIALADDGFRRQIFEDLRDSPFPQHALHLSSYLSGKRGRSVMAAIRGGLGREKGAFRSALASAPNLALRIPTAHGRLSWDGGADSLGVFAVQPGMDAAAPVGGYWVGGAPAEIAPHERSTAPLMIVGPSAIGFGAEPEDRRARAPKKERATVSDRDEEFGGGMVANLVGGCEDDPSGPGCGGGSSPSSYVVAGTGSWCWGSSGDADNDGFLDSCEYTLAAAFAPALRIMLDDLDASRESYWLAMPHGSGVRIFYALAYHQDTGLLFGHKGDSEFVVVDAKYVAASYWRLDRVFLAAHYGAWPADGSRWVSGAYYPTFPSRPLAPIVWVSEQKHASFPSKEACDRSWLWSDDCDYANYVTTTEVLPNANLGGYTGHILNCVASRMGYSGYECFWSHDRFKGWFLNASSDATGYRDHFSDFMWP